MYAQAEDDFNRVETNFLNSRADRRKPRAKPRSGATCG